LRELVVTKGGVRQAGSDGPGETMRRLKRTSERSLYVFTKAILGWKLLFPTLHGKVCEFLQTIPPRRKGVLMPRGTFKTTIAKALVIHMTIQSESSNVYFPGCQGTNTRVLYCAETTDRAETRLRYMKEVYESNQLLRAFWPEATWEDPALAKTKWNQQRLLLPRTMNYDECTIERTGVDAAITGGHFDVFVKDDLISLKARNEEATMRSAIDWNHSSASLANGLEHYQEFYFGTRWGAWDLYTDVQEIDPDVIWYERQAIEDGVLIDPIRLPLKELERLRRQDEDLFYLNYMNSTAGSKMQDFNMADVRSFKVDGAFVEYDDRPIDSDLEKLFEVETTDDPIEVLKRRLLSGR
jgi:hypothetical protein